jgi:hypothetical protein
MSIIFLNLAVGNRMKKLLLILLCLPFIGFGQQTYVPDDNFEAYLEANGMGNGTPNDDYVTTANINLITFLDVSNKNISDLTGIEEFTALEQFGCSFNQITYLDVSANDNLYELYAPSNPLTSIDISGAISLTKLVLYDNNLSSIDVSNNTALAEIYCQNNNLISLDISSNPNLTYLWCTNNQLTSLDINSNIDLINLDCSNNQLTSLDVSQNTALTQLVCMENQLTNLDVRNGNNYNLSTFYALNNPNLTCINVDNAAWSTALWTGFAYAFDNHHYFNNNCNGTTLVQDHFTNKELLKVTGLLGRETKQTNQPLFYIYDDGTVEKRIVIE